MTRDRDVLQIRVRELEGKALVLRRQLEGVQAAAAAAATEHALALAAEKEHSAKLTRTYEGRLVGRHPFAASEAACLGGSL